MRGVDEEWARRRGEGAEEGARKGQGKGKEAQGVGEDARGGLDLTKKRKTNHMFTLF